MSTDKKQHPPQKCSLLLPFFSPRFTVSASSALGPVQAWRRGCNKLDHIVPVKKSNRM